MTIQVVSHSIEQPVEKPVEQKEESKSAREEIKESPVQKNPSESETEETEVNEEESKYESETEEESEESDDLDNDKPKKKGGFKRKIDKLISQREAAKQEVEYWKSQALKEKSASEPKPEPKVETIASDQDEPDPDNFETHKEYVKAVTKWTLDQDKKASRQEEEKSKLLSEQEQIIKSHHEREKSFSEKTEDYAELVTELFASKPAISAAFEELLVSSEMGPEILYALAKDVNEFKRLNSLSYGAVAKEFGKLEVKLSSQSSEEKKQEPKKITKAPQPIAPVGSKGGSVSKSIDDPNLSQKEYEALRLKQMRASSA